MELMYTDMNDCMSKVFKYNGVNTGVPQYICSDYSNDQERLFCYHYSYYNANSWYFGSELRSYSGVTPMIAGCTVNSLTSILSNWNNCIQCPQGTYASISGASVCTSCPAGTYASTSGLTACTQCAEGTYSTAVEWKYPSEITLRDSLALTPPYICTTKFVYRELVNNIPAYKCDGSELYLFSYTDDWYYQNWFLSTSGSYINEKAYSPGACPTTSYGLDCGYIADIVQASSAVRVNYYLSCAAGTYASVLGSINCTQCAAGRYISASGSQYPVEIILPLSFQFDLSSLSECESTIFRMDAMLQGAPSYTCTTASAVMVRCDNSKWYYESLNVGLIPLSLVNSGCDIPNLLLSLPPFNPNYCTQCSAGTYASSARASACDACLPNTYSTSLGASSCSSCEIRAISDCIRGQFLTGCQGSSQGGCSSCKNVN
jgi:hypothetical protein